MNTTHLGLQAEQLVIDELIGQDYKILAQNWKRRICEIDIVARKDEVIFFVEVKYRSREGQGGGLDYITPKKLKQLKFAAEIWVSENDWHGDCRLMAASVKKTSNRLILDEIVEIS